MAHPHLWVRQAAAQLLGFILAAVDVEKIILLLENPSESNDEEDGFIYADPKAKLRSLILDSVAQLLPDTEFEELYNEVVKNLVFIARLLKITSSEGKQSISNGDEEVSKDISLLWLTKKLRKCINLEISQAPKSTLVVS